MEQTDTSMRDLEQIKPYAQTFIQHPQNYGDNINLEYNTPQNVRESIQQTLHQPLEEQKIYPFLKATANGESQTYYLVPASQVDAYKDVLHETNINKNTLNVGNEKVDVPEGWKLGSIRMSEQQAEALKLSDGLNPLQLKQDAFERIASIEKNEKNHLEVQINYTDNEGNPVKINGAINAEDPKRLQVMSAKMETSLDNNVKEDQKTDITKSLTEPSKPMATTFESESHSKNVENAEIASKAASEAYSEIEKQQSQSQSQTQSRGRSFT